MAFARLLVMGMFFFSFAPMSAQNGRPWEEYLEQSGLMEDIESEDVTTRYDELCELAANPINLNHATREQLDQIPFLTPEQFVALVEYVDKVGVVRSWSELVVAGVVDDRMARLLQYFVCLGNPPNEQQRLSLANMMRYGKHEAMGYLKIPCYRRRGDDDGYLGYPYRHWIRYTYTYRQDVKMGFVGSQDAGEPFFASPNNLGYDYYSFFLQLKNQGWLRSLVLGRYRLRMGAGLVLNTNYSFGKLSSLSGLGRQGVVLTGHSSRSEANYLQGAAVTIDLARRWEMTFFLSSRRLDATLNSDSATVATLLTSGYHRTQSEIDRRHNTSQTLLGGNVAYHHGGFRLGLSGVYNAYNRPLNPDTAVLYRRYAAVGERFWNLGLEYSYLAPRFSFSGETATGNSGGVATINRLSYAPLSALTLIGVQRFYSYRYQALMGRSFSEGGHVNNESGIYVGCVWKMAKCWTLTAYTDYAYFSWPRYRISFSSHVWDNLISAEYHRRNITWQLRYRLKSRQEDTSDHSALATYSVQRWQTSFKAVLGQFTTRTLLSGVVSARSSGSHGWMASEQAAYAHGPLQVAATVSYFDTDDYESRLYAYEYGLLYVMNNPAFYGAGMRGTITARWAVSPVVMVAMKAGSTAYFDRDKIGSGLQQIDSRRQTDIEMQVRFKF